MVLHENLYKAGVVFRPMFSCFALYLALMPYWYIIYILFSGKYTISLWLTSTNAEYPPTTNSNHHFKWNVDWFFQDRRVSCEQGCGQFFVLPAEEEMVQYLFLFQLHQRKLRWNLKIHRFCRFLSGVYSNSTVSFWEYIPCHNPMRRHLQAPSGQNLPPGGKGMSGTLGPGGKGPGMAMPPMPMPGGKGMPGMPNHKGNGCRGMNQQGMQGMQSMNPMGMQQGPSMAQQSLAMHMT